MKNTFPLPPPDRRQTKKNSYSINNFSDSLTKDEVPEFRMSNNLNMLKMKHIEDMRKNIFSYQLFEDKDMFLSKPSDSLSVNHCNIMLFGPSGSGKSSFIHTLYRALYGTNVLPPEAMDKLIIRETSKNEGTLCFTRLFLKEESNTNSTGIIVCDTRGHIWMNSDEKEQFKVIIEGKAKDDVVVQQIEKRNPLLLWEFWKKDSELFPKEIFRNDEAGIGSIPHAIVLVFDGSKEDILDDEDSEFYKQLVKISYSKSYKNIYVVITRIDIFEKQINEKYKSLNESERNNILNTSKDLKIEKIIEILGIQRSNIYFVENYHSNMDLNLVDIDHQALKILSDLLNACEQYILFYLNYNASCFAKCF